MKLGICISVFFTRYFGVYLVVTIDCRRGICTGVKRNDKEGKEGGGGEEEKEYMKGPCNASEMKKK